MTRLTERDRVAMTEQVRLAMRLAYLRLRKSKEYGVSAAYVVLELEDDTARQIVLALDRARWSYYEDENDHDDPRVRAKLALLLRALLRADAGDQTWTEWRVTNADGNWRCDGVYEFCVHMLPCFADDEGGPYFI
jgi:hypothetical protein